MVHPNTNHFTTHNETFNNRDFKQSGKTREINPRVWSSYDTQPIIKLDCHGLKSIDRSALDSGVSCEERRTKI